MDLSSPESLSLTDDADRLGYLPRPGLHDEMVGPGGCIRAPWQTFLLALQELGLPGLMSRWEEARHLIRENGVTYNVYGDPRGMDRPWQLDPIPLLIGAEEAAVIERGLVQRARLLELILADLYGPQTLLRENLYPPELVFANPSFLRACHGVHLPGNHFLHLYAANLARSPDGQIWVLGDRTQGPSGAGYALENRIVLSRTLPDPFHDCQVQRLALFFRTLRETLASLALHNRDNPRIVLLTPGPYNETYFEHAFLARYLGYTLVEGGDLTVRDAKVYLKVLGGLQQVDVIFRRLDDDFCDPLELRADSFLGVPGLMHAVRSGNVAVANALGTGLLETPALLAFLPVLCRRLLGEELRIPSVATWWCGHPDAMQHVLKNLRNLVVKPVFAAARMEPQFGDRLNRRALEALAARIRARPRDYVGQESVQLSAAPVLAGDRLEPRQLVLRAYLAAKDDSFVTMPGGLTRFTASADTLVVSMQRGGGSKDTWVLASGPVSDFSLLKPTTLHVELSRGGSELPSRAADNLFWLGRYAERAEGVTRLLRGVIVRLTAESGPTEVPELPALLRTLNQLAPPRRSEEENGAAVRSLAPEDETLAVIFDVERRGSLASVLQQLTRLAGTVRDRISGDMWRVLNLLHSRQWAADLARPREQEDDWAECWVELPEDKEHAPTSAFTPDRYPLSAVLDLLNRTVARLVAFGGLAMESMTRGQGWRFLDMGRKLERSLFTITLVRSLVGSVQGAEGPLLETLLEVADSSMTYRRRYLGSLQTAPVLDLLLADETNPRSLAFQMAALADDVEHLPRETTHPGRSPEQRLMLAALTALRLADVERLAQPDAEGARPHLEELLGRLATELPSLSESITRHYLSHLQTSRHLGGGKP